VRLFKLKSIIIPFLSLVFIFAGREAFSASQIPFLESEIIVETSPSNPIPNQEVTIYISSYSIDLNRSTITWSSENGVVSSGIGKTSYTFNAPPANTSAVFSISITSPTGESVIKKISIRPADIDIFWESENGYTPPFYKGKSLPITNSSIKLVAIPNVNSSRGFSFVWKKDDKVLNDKSGYDKSYYKFINSSFDLSNQITVVASAVQGDYVAQKSIDVSVYEPEIVFYKKDPAFGVDYNNAIVNNYKVQDDETTIVAEPYHFLMKENQNKFIYDWSINNKSIETPSKKNELSIKPTSRSGYAIIGLNIYHINNMFQDVYKSIKINF
jgi:hypothetical protein